MLTLCECFLVTCLWSRCEITSILLADGSHMTWKSCIRHHQLLIGWNKTLNQDVWQWDATSHSLRREPGYNRNQRYSLSRELNTALEYWRYGNFNMHYAILKGCLHEKEVKSFEVHGLEATEPLLCAPKQTNSCSVLRHWPKLWT